MRCALPLGKQQQYNQQGANIVQKTILLSILLCAFASQAAAQGSEAAAQGSEAPRNSAGQKQQESVPQLASSAATGAKRQLRAYPLIRSLGKADSTFAQLVWEVNENQRRWDKGQPLLPLALYVYIVGARDNIFAISKQSGISLEGIATLNRMLHPGGLPQGHILLPNHSGIFVPPSPSATAKAAPKPDAKPGAKLETWEERLREGRKNLLFHRLVVGGQVYWYYPNSRFRSGERRQFLSQGFRSPVQPPLRGVRKGFVITSPFGTRRDPISGRQSFHDGIDIRSPYGAAVYSISDATVIEVGQSVLYGLFVRLRLDNGKQQQAIYGHLTALLVRKGQQVRAGEAIGNSGNSGRSTGPHLHLSIFEQGRAVDPARLLRNMY